MVPIFWASLESFTKQGGSKLSFTVKKSHSSSILGVGIPQDLMCVCLGGSQEEAGIDKTVTYQQTLEKVCCSVLYHKWLNPLSALFVDGTLAGYPHLRNRETEAKQS